MEKLKFLLISIVTLTVLGLMSYWAVVTIQSGSEHSNIEKIEKLENENGELKREVEKLESELGSSEQEVENLEEQTKVETVVPAPTTTYKNQTLINELQKLIDDNVFVRLKSRGTRVGTVQKFLNIYNDTTNKIDNDFGENMKNAVIAFQKDQGLTADGEAGKTTFAKMIDWLKKEG